MFRENEFCIVRVAPVIPGGIVTLNVMKCFPVFRLVFLQMLLYLR